MPLFLASSVQGEETWQRRRPGPPREAPPSPSSRQVSKWTNGMKTRRKTHEVDPKRKGDRNMAPRPEGSPVSTPRTRSPVKGVRTGGVTCSGPDALSMLSMLAEVASVTLHTDPSVTDTAVAAKTKASNSGNRKPSEYEVLTLEQVSNMTDNLLVKLFSDFESNEMWRRFTYTCRMLPAACSQFFQSFGSEHKARAGMKAHLLSHLKSLLDVHTSEQSRQNYILESVPARKRRLCEQESSTTKRRGASVSSRTTKLSATPKTPTRGGENSRSRKAVHMTPEKENDSKRKIGVFSKEHKKMEVATSFLQTDNIKKESKSLQEIPRNETKPKRKLETSRDSRTRAKKIKAVVSESPLENDDMNNNNNNNNGDVKMEVKSELEEDHPPMQQAVSHDHGYLKASPSLKAEATACRVFTPNEQYSSEDSQQGHHQHLPQVSGIVEESAGISMAGKEVPSREDHSTLLHEHMNQELQGGIMAQDSGSSSTPLPVVGCEVEFTPDQQYKVMRSADLPVVYDHNNPPSNIQTVSRIIERDEYKVRKKPKGRAKFIGQSKVEKEMALKLITEIRSLPVMALDTLECKICHPPRLFTAPSTLLSHYRSHAGIRPYECRICEAVFTRQHSLNYHMLIHTNQTRFTCVDCGRKFRHPSHFKEHRRRHTGESPYECSDCLMRFKTRNTYKRHLRTRHGKLLTTQGAIIILSQEEADRMKKTQGRKPRRPRQPLQIIKTIPENESEVAGFENSQIIAQVPEQAMNQVSEECTDFTSDNVLPEEVITICAGEENTGDGIPTAGSQTNGGTQGVGGSTSGANRANPQTSPSGRWVYLVEYIQGQDGRLAKVYRGSASLVNRNNQNVGVEVPASSSSNVMMRAPVNRDNAKVTVMSSTVTSPPPAVCISNSVVKTPGKLVVQAGNGEYGKASSTAGSSTVPSHVLSKPNNQSNHGQDANDRVVINKQVVNNVVVNNHIVKNGSIVSVSCGEHSQMPVSCCPQPVVLAAGPAYSGSSSSEDHLRSQGHQILPTQNLAGKSQDMFATGTKCQEVAHHAVNGNLKDQVFEGHSVDHLVTVDDGVLLENVEIIESMDPGTAVNVTVTGIIESNSIGREELPGEYNTESQMQVPRRAEMSQSSSVSNTSRVKVEEVRHGDSPLVEAGGELMDNFLNQHSANQSECEVSSSPDHRTLAQSSKVLDAPQSSSEQVSSIHGINSIATMSSSALMPAAVQI
ncbi:putative zinc finger protein [Penaeus vannamei]|uniref:Putative zinc finger protein n=1 Tax=Penaeus vannamei TaxID=6689 RepID=A0A3R7N4M3_PENVA|nr:putative zinc finger protein [Penaeus vannamei]